MTLSTKRFYQGFTLLELMVTIVIVSILAAIILPSYASYVRGAQESQVQQEMLKLSIELEKHKSRNYSYNGFSADYFYPNLTNFDVASQTLNFPISSSANQAKFNITITNNLGNLLTTASANASEWSIKATSTDSNLNSMLLTSRGVQCKNKASSLITFTSCGTSGSEDW